MGSTNFHRIHRLPQTFIDFHRLPQTSTDFCRLPQTSTDLHRLPQTSTDFHRLPKKNLENQKIENVVVDISKSPDCIFFLFQEMKEKKQKSLEIFLNFLFSHRFKRSRIL